MRLDLTAPRPGGGNGAAPRRAVRGLLFAGWTRPLVAGAFAFVAFVMFLRIEGPFNDGEIGAVERAVGQRAVRLLRGFAVS